MKRKAFNLTLLLLAVVPIVALADQTFETTSTRCSAALGTCKVTQTTFSVDAAGNITILSQTEWEYPYSVEEPPLEP